jgi:LuxR family glucitol operon transcriptional activator
MTDRPYHLFGKLLTQGITALAANRRQSIGLLQKQLAESLGISANTVYGWRRGERLPDSEIAAELARKFVRGWNADETWIEQFLAAAEYGPSQAVETLTLELFSQKTLHANIDASLEKRLELPPEIQLIGVEESIHTLLEVLLSPEAACLISIEGLGGIGKTALASALVHQPKLTTQFSNIVWVSAKQQDFMPGVGFEQATSPALTADALIDALLMQFDDTISLSQPPQQKRAILTALLKKDTHLVVIDNLETVVDYQELLPTLRSLARPNKFLLTSRHSLRAHSDVFCYTLEELNQTETFHFIKHEARLRGLSMLLDASETQLETIYEVVGGNPLALKLVIGQVSVFPISQVLENLKQAHSRKIDELYNYIYWHAWQALDIPSQQVLLAMPLAQDGTLDQLIALSELDIIDLNQALEQLVALSLVQIGGNLDERRYYIHRLTETFLLNEVVKWGTSP